MRCLAAIDDTVCEYKIAIKELGWDDLPTECPWIKLLSVLMQSDGWKKKYGELDQKVLDERRRDQRMQTYVRPEKL